jgi:hypothetical protein
MGLVQIEADDRFELVARMSPGQRLLLGGLSLVPLMAPYELLVKVHWGGSAGPVLWVAAIVSLGAIAVTGLLLFSALAGLSSRMIFDKRAGRLIYSASALVVRPWVRDFPIGAIARVETAIREWSDGDPSYSLRVVLTDGERLRSGSSWSRAEIDAIQVRLARFLGLD